MTAARKVAIVTGASRGIGAAIAKHLAASGLAVVVNCRTGGREAEAVSSAIVAAGGEASPFQADVSSESEAKALVAFAVETFGRLDVLVNNAGLAVGCPLAEIDAEHVNALTAVNIAGVLFASKHAALAFGETGGAIINISSTNATSPLPGAAVYCATKAAVNAMTVSLASELGAKGIRVNAVAPGLTMTDRYEAEIPDDAKTEVIGNTPLGRLGVPSDIAGVVGFLASDAAGWITGEVIAVSGGAR